MLYQVLPHWPNDRVSRNGVRAKALLEQKEDAIVIVKTKCLKDTKAQTVDLQRCCHIFKQGIAYPHHTQAYYVGFAVYTGDDKKD